MFTPKKILSSAAAFAVMAVMSAASHAAPVAVGNFSFEDPAQGAGGFSNDQAIWVDEGANGNSFVERIAGFAADGVQHLGMQGDTRVHQDLGISVAPGATYTLTVAIGNRNAGFSPNDGLNDSTLEIFAGQPNAGGILLATGSFDTGAQGASTFRDVSINFVAGGPVAGNIFLALSDIGPGRAHFDNVRFDEVLAVPEPASASLIGLAALGMLRRRRRMA